MFRGVWVLLFLALLIVLVVNTIYQLIDYRKTKNSVHLFKLLKLWLIPSFVVGLLLIVGQLNKPKGVDKSKIIGIYEVDNNFYPGKNADWQKQHFRFEIRKDNVFILYVRLADDTEKQYLGNVTWANESPEKWSVIMINPHHIIDKHPLLYREKFDFYYVFRTQKFGNMFFRKISSTYH